MKIPVTELTINSDQFKSRTKRITILSLDIRHLLTLYSSNCSMPQNLAIYGDHVYSGDLSPYFLPEDYKYHDLFPPSLVSNYLFYFSSSLDRRSKALLTISTLSWWLT